VNDLIIIFDRLDLESSLYWLSLNTSDDTGIILFSRRLGDNPSPLA